MAFTKEELYWRASMYDSRTDFRLNDSAAYYESRRVGDLDAVCSHMPRRKYRYTLIALTIEAEKYTTRYQFCRGSNKEYQATLRQHAMDLVCSHMTDNYTPQIRHASIRHV